MTVMDAEAGRSIHMREDAAMYTAAGRVFTSGTSPQQIFIRKVSYTQRILLSLINTQMLPPFNTLNCTGSRRRRSTKSRRRFVLCGT